MLRPRRRRVRRHARQTRRRRPRPRRGGPRPRRARRGGGARDDRDVHEGIEPAQRLVVEHVRLRLKRHDVGQLVSGGGFAHGRFLFAARHDSGAAIPRDKPGGTGRLGRDLPRSTEAAPAFRRSAGVSAMLAIGKMSKNSALCEASPDVMSNGPSRSGVRIALTHGMQMIPPRAPDASRKAGLAGEIYPTGATNMARPRTMCAPCVAAEVR